MRSDAAAMQGDQLLNDRQTDAEPAARAGKRSVVLREQVEDVWKQLRGHSDAGVPHSHHDGIVIPRHAQHDAALRGGYFAALFSKFTMICSSRKGSPSTTIDSSGSDNDSLC